MSPSDADANTMRDLAEALEHLTELFADLAPLGADTEREMAVVNARLALAAYDARPRAGGR